MTGIVTGAFDLCHAGHIGFFREAKKRSGWLIAALNVKPNKGLKESVSERAIRLNSCKYIDEIIPYETEEELVELLRLVQPDIRFLGGDYRKKKISGKNIIPITFIPRNHHQSSTNLRSK